MKRIIPCLIFCSFLLACSPKLYMNSYSIDLFKYSHSGFFITESNSVSFDYTPICLIGTQGGGKQYIRGELTKLYLDDVFDKFVADCKANGADAVINLKISQNYGDSENIFYISGMAVKRK